MVQRPMTAEAPAELLVYCNCMQRVKHHVKIVEDTFAGGVIAPSHPDHIMLLSELIFMHFRKALEEIAFASLSANREKYAKARPGYSTEWNGRRMLGFIEKVNPDFYPIPLMPPQTIAPGNRHLDRMEPPFLTREDFERLYDAAAEIIHAPNPFSEQKVINTYLTVPEWIVRIQRLLSWHLVSIVGLQGVWCIQVPGDGPTRGFLAIADGPFFIQR
jgi:hypothetical protein